MARRILLASLTAPLALTACSDDLPSDPPKSIERVAAGGFTSPTDAVASLDGKEFYFAAYDDAKVPAIFKVAAVSGSTAQKLAEGEPLESPLGLVLSCD